MVLNPEKFLLYISVQIQETKDFELRVEFFMRIDGRKKMDVVTPGAKAYTYIHTINSVSTKQNFCQ